MAFEVDGSEFLDADLDLVRIGVGVESGVDLKAGFGGGRGDRSITVWCVSSGLPRQLMLMQLDAVGR
jgi:hypothetical protein